MMFSIANAKQALTGDRAVAMVEFAFAVPFLVITHIGGAYFADMNMANNKVSRAAQALVRAAAEDDVITTAEVTALLNGAQAMLDPMRATSSLVLTSVRGELSSKWEVRWSDALGTSALTPSTLYALDAGAQAGFTGTPPYRNILIADVRVNYSGGLARMWNSLAWMPFSVNATSVLSDRAYALPSEIFSTGDPLRQDYNASTATMRDYGAGNSGPNGLRRAY